MRPICQAVMLASIMLAGCAPVLQHFKTSAQACRHMEDTDPVSRLKEPCKYAASLAMCFELPEKLRQKVVEECEQQRAEIRNKVSDALKSHAKD